MRLRDDGTAARLPLDDVIWDGAALSMAEIQFAAGAKKVAVHEECAGWDLGGGEAGIAQLPMQFSHARGQRSRRWRHESDAARSVVDARRHHRWATDGSRRFAVPHSIGANPRQSVYGIVARNISALAGRSPAAHLWSESWRWRHGNCWLLCGELLFYTLLGGWLVSRGGWTPRRRSASGWQALSVCACTSCC